jgi:hypothetical protein
LDSLAGGLCTADAFLAAMHERFQDGDGNWEVLSLLDQYHRRGKLPPGLFQTLKSRLEDSALTGVGEGVRTRPPPVLTEPYSRQRTAIASIYRRPVDASPSRHCIPR